MDVVTLLRYAFDLEPAGGREARLRDDLRQRSATGQPLRCRGCNNAVTDRKAATTVNGAHQHRYRNPAGIEFGIGCFSSAPGCRGTGERVLEYTWFAGYGWQVVACRECNQHLGWHYAGQGSSFYGLILSRLISAH